MEKIVNMTQKEVLVFAEEAFNWCESKRDEGQSSGSESAPER